MPLDYQWWRQVVDAEISGLCVLDTIESTIVAEAFCIDLHTTDARKVEESERRLATIFAWREPLFFNDGERAALAWTESLTNIAQTHSPAQRYELLAANFNRKEMADLPLAVLPVNA